MNVLDVMIVLASAGAALGGYRLGFVTRAAAWIGMCAGAFLAIRIAPPFTSRFVDVDPNRLLLISAITLLSGAFVGQLIGQSVGHQLRRRAIAGRGAKADKVAGAASGVLIVCAAVWLLTPTMASVPNWPSRMVGGSVLAHQIESLTPDPPDALTAASKLVGEEQWAELSAEFAGGLPSGPVPPLVAVPEDIDTAVARRHDAGLPRRVRPGRAGGYRLSGGFESRGHERPRGGRIVQGPGRGARRVGTNARGAGRDLRHQTRSGGAARRQCACRAVASRRGRRTRQRRLGVRPSRREDLRVRPFRVGAETEAEVPDIYGERTVVRRIVPIRAELAKGDSGSPLLNERGEVVGVAFAISPDDEALAVAIAMPLVHEAIRVAEARGADAAALGTGRCLPAD